MNGENINVEKDNQSSDVIRLGELLQTKEISNVYLLNKCIN